MIEAILLICFFGVVYSVGASVAFAIFVFMYIKKYAITKYDYAALLLPLLIWSTLMLTNIMPKSLSNFGDALCVGGTVSVLSLVRVLMAKSQLKNLHQIFMVLTCLSALIVYFTIPALPE